MAWKVAQRLHGSRHRFFAEALLFVDVAHQPQRARVPVSSRRWPDAILFEDDTRPEFEPMSITATGDGWWFGRTGALNAPLY
jgi:hypothetical protein